MAEPVTIARPYAEAAFATAKQSNSLDRWSDMLGMLDALVQDETMAQRLNDPNVDDRSLETVLLGLLGERVDGQGRNLVQVLVRNGRLAVVPQIRELYDQLRRDHEGTLEAKVISALPLSDEQVRELLAALERKYGLKVNAQVEVDPELIGGVRFVVGDKVIDGTVRGKLDAMAAALTH